MSNPVIDRFRNKRWYNSNGELHRLDGPAFEWFDGIKEWYVDGKLHRLDGPAIEDVNGNKSWWVAGNEVSERNYAKAVAAYKQEALEDKEKETIENLFKDLEELDRKRQDILGRIKYIISL